MFPLCRKAYLINKLKNRDRAEETHERSKERCRQKKPVAAEYSRSKGKQKELRSDDGKATWLAEGECPSICGK